MSFINTLSKRNQKEFLKNHTEDFDYKKSYFFHGIAGSGKTSKSLFFVKKWLKLLKIPAELETENVKFVRFSDLVELSKSTFKEGYEGANSRGEIKEITKCRFLVLDDLGTEKNTEYVDKIIYDLINYRFEEELQTVFTSNYSLENITKNYHDRIASRITEICGKSGIIKFKDFDYRQYSEGFTHEQENTQNNSKSQSETKFEPKEKALETRTPKEIMLESIKKTNPNLAKQIENGSQNTFFKIAQKLTN